MIVIPCFSVFIKLIKNNSVIKLIIIIRVNYDLVHVDFSRDVLMKCQKRRIMTHSYWNSDFA